MVTICCHAQYLHQPGCTELADAGGLQVSQGIVSKVLGSGGVDSSGTWRQSVLVCTAAVHPGEPAWFTHHAL